MNAAYYSRQKKKKAFVEPTVAFKNMDEFTQYVNKNIDKGFILDVFERLSTLFRASDKKDFDGKRDIFFNVIVADNKDKLLYRMITLNNGQKGMTPRHQIEILTQELFDFNSLKHKVQTEKEKSEKPIKGAFSLGDISRGYIAFLTANVHNETQKSLMKKWTKFLLVEF